MLKSAKLYLGVKRTLFIGEINEPVKSIQPASTITFSLDKPIKLIYGNDKKEIETRSFLLPPDKDIIINSNDSPVAVCMLDPLGSDYAALSTLMRKNDEPVKFDIENESSYISEFKKFYYEELTLEKVDQYFSEIFSGHIEHIHKIDPRVVKVIELIQLHVEENVSTEYFANEIGVSSPRLVQLFREQVGIPIRRYRLWHRLFCATRKFGITKSLSTGAHAAGFSDAAHFNRTFKRMMGMAPSKWLSQPNGIKIYSSSNSVRECLNKF